MTNGNYNAFPVALGGKDMNGQDDLVVDGLTKREYFAAKAMQGMLANPELFKIMSTKLASEQHCEFLNGAAIEQADDMIEQLNKQTYY